MRTILHDYCGVYKISMSTRPIVNYQSAVCSVYRQDGSAMPMDEPKIEYWVHEYYIRAPVL